jgi:hypothetical protein
LTIGTLSPSFVRAKLRLELFKPRIGGMNLHITHGIEINDQYQRHLITFTDIWLAIQPTIQTTLAHIGTQDTSRSHRHENHQLHIQFADVAQPTH